jgi:TatD DNase family protein
MLVDIHTHNKAQEGIPAIQNLDFAQSEKILSSGENGLFSVGFHPWTADEYNADSFLKLEKWSQDKRVVAIGECGLDKFSEVPFALQLSVFEQQIALSERVMKPIIIHCVGHYNELFELKKLLRPKQYWIIHGFRKKPELALQALNAGCGLSFGVHFNAGSVKVTPIESIFVETGDSDAEIKDIYNKLAIIKLCNEEDLNAGHLLLQSIIKQNTVEFR